MNGFARAKHFMPAAGLALSIAVSSPAAADSIGAVSQELAQVLAQMEGNLVTRDAIEMNTKDWKSRSASVEARVKDYGDRVDSHNAYCQGTFETEEYNRRVAACASLASQLDTLKAQIQPEIENRDIMARDLQARETERANAYQKLETQISGFLPRLIGFCAGMAPEERKTSCRLPPAPGPRTAPMVNEMSATLSGAFGQ